MARGAIENTDVVTRIDDCWNRIGTRSDGSCPKLAEHSRCLNCPVFEDAAARLLDRPGGDMELGQSAASVPTPLSREPASAALNEPVAVETSANSGATQSALVFRIAEEWLGLPTVALRQ